MKQTSIPKMKLSKITHICSLPTLVNEVNASRIFKVLLYFMFEKYDSCLKFHIVNLSILSQRINMWTKMLKKKDAQKMFVQGTVRKKLWKIIHETNRTGWSQHRNEEIKFWAGGLNEKKIHLHQFGSTYCYPLRTQEQSLRKLILSVSHPERGQVSPLTLGCLATK